MTLAVGFFDGVHLGHQAILRGADAALTFRNHPLSLLAPARAPALIMPLDERLAAIRACGVRTVTALEFDAALAALPPEEFIARHLRGCRVRAGANWRFGCRGAGNADFLAAQGVEVETVPYVLHGGEPISSTRIRAAIARGALEEACAMMGRPYRVCGTVFAGKGVGRSLGYPTVNLRVASLPMPRGVYAVRLGDARAIANYGCAPTFGAEAWSEPVLEVHFPEGPVALPQPSAAVDFLSFIRPERVFPSPDDLRAAIASDLRAAGM